MAKFKYEGRNQMGEKVADIIDAADLDEAARFLENRGIIPLQVKAVSSNDFVSKFFENLSVPKVKKGDILVFARQMAVLLGAGVPIIKAVHQLADSTRSKGMAIILKNVALDLEGGKRMAVAMAAHPNAFPPVVTNLIEVGENTGKLETAFGEAARFLESALATRKRLFAAIRYPIIVICAVILAMTIMSIFVIPKFANLFARYGAKLPVPTRIMIGLSNLMINHWGKLLLGIIIVVLLIRFALPFERVRMEWDRVKLRIPILGELVLRIVLSQFSRTLAMVIRAGVPVLNAIKLAGSVTGNLYVTQQITKMHDAVDKGEKVSSASKAVGLFDPIALQMLEIGDETGKVDDMLDNIADAYESEIDYDIKRLTDLIEPILLIFIGAAVVLLALAVYLPMWDMIKVMKH